MEKRITNSSFKVPASMTWNEIGYRIQTGGNSFSYDDMVNGMDSRWCPSSGHTLQLSSDLR